MARINPDFHVVIEIIRQGRQPGAVLFVFPAPALDGSRPRQSRTFLLTAGELFEGEPATSFPGSRIIEVEV